MIKLKIKSESMSVCKDMTVAEKKADKLGKSE